MIFDGGNPEPQQVGAPAFDDFVGIQSVAKRLRHRLAFFVERPAVRDYAAKRRFVLDARGHEKGAVEPAAILVRALEVNVSRPLRTLQDRQVRGAGIEPHVENIVFLAPLCRTAGALCSGRQKLVWRVLIPRIGALFFKPTHNVAQSAEIFQACSARVAIENDNGHAPKALARDAPVRAFLDHFVHAVFAPRGNPLDVTDLAERFLAQRSSPAVRRRVDLDEPLLGGAKNYGIVAAPAMRVAVLVFMVAEQRPAVRKQVDDDGIRGEHILALVFRQAFEINAAIVEWRVNLQTILLAGVKVVGAMTGRGVYDAAALVERYVVSENAGHLDGQKGVLKFHPRKLGALEFGANASFLDSAFGL